MYARKRKPPEQKRMVVFCYNPVMSEREEAPEVSAKELIEIISKYNLITASKIRQKSKKLLEETQRTQTRLQQIDHEFNPITESELTPFLSTKEIKHARKPIVEILE
jgi:hypothetical protein